MSWRSLSADNNTLFLLCVGHYRTASQDLQQAPGLEAVERSQVVAVGTPLPTASLPAGAHQGPVMVRGHFVTRAIRLQVTVKDYDT